MILELETLPNLLSFASDFDRLYPDKWSYVEPGPNPAAVLWAIDIEDETARDPRVCDLIDMWGCSVCNSR